MKISKPPIWRKSMLNFLNLYEIKNFLEEISEDGDIYGYEKTEYKDSYYNDYKELFDDLAEGAWILLNDNIFMNEESINKWDDIMVALLGKTEKILGYNAEMEDCYDICDIEEKFAQEEALKRIERLTKKELIAYLSNVLTVLLKFFDIKAAHDCLVSIVEELDERGSILQRKIDNLVKDTKLDADEIPQRMWIE